MNRRYARQSLVMALALIAFLFVINSSAVSASAPNGQAPPASTQSNQTVEGFWLGALDTGVFKLRLMMKFSKSEDGKLKGSLDSLDQNANDIPMTAVTFQDGVLHVELKSIGASYDGKLSADGMQLNGDFTQGGKLPLNLKRIEKASDGAIKRPQTPIKPYPYDEFEVTYQNPQDKVTLAATLTVPKGAGPFPAVVLITGSGAQDRDEALLGHRPFLVLSDYLTRRGIAVLRADDRGVGGTSKGAESDTSENYVGDALAGVEFLKTRREINPKQIGLVGHSEGGMIAPMAAAKSNDVAFIVLMAGPGIPGDKLLVMQNGLISAAECEKEVKKSMEEVAALFELVKNEKNPAATKQKLLEERKRMEDGARKQLEGQLASAGQRIAEVFTPWYRFFLGYDPRPTLLKVRVPVLALNGDKDTQVPAKEDLDGIEQALKDGGNHDFKIVMLPKLNHLFQTSVTGSPSEYSTIEETIAPVALQTIGDWIVAHTTAPK